ncbi:MAG TPA: hypothetical protein VL068_12100 [Microthrixaceae bacterium]|nr:hypothetical protein [Microthrixaceae bacterium]
MSDPNVYIFSATANYASVDRLIEVASLSEIDVTFRAWERQMLVRLPGGASIVIDGKREVLSARQILGR